MVIFLGYEFSPNMMGIQEGYNKNFHIKSVEYYEKSSLYLEGVPIIQRVKILMKKLIKVGLER